LFQQLITEGVVLGSLGGGMGILVAFGALRYFRGTSPVELPAGADISLNLPLLAFALLISLATAVLFGMAPAWRGSLAALGARGMVGGRLRLVKLLVAGEMALSVILLAGAGLLMESVLRMGSAPMGFDPDHLYFTDIPVPKNPRFYDVVEGRVSGIPGVQSAALTSALPTNLGGFDVLDVMGTTGTGVHDVGHKMVSPSYFETLRVALLAGRSFNAHDREGSGLVAVINDTLAREYFLGRDPLGQRVRVSKDAPYATIVGVVASEKQTTVTEEMNYVASPTLYRPLAQDPAARLSIAIRTASDAVPIGAAIRREMAALDPNLAVRDLESMRHKLATFMAYPRFRAVLLSAFAAFALLLAAVGLHRVLGQLVAQRTAEIGVRMALGASPADVAGLIVRQAGAPVVAGLGIGLGLAMFLDRYFSIVLYGVRPRDPATLAGTSLVLLAVAAVATALLAYRAAKTDPVEALR
jgi:putative ABC transport system permease protein